MKKKGVFAFVGGTELREEPNLRGATIPEDGRQSCVLEAREEVRIVKSNER